MNLGLGFGRDGKSNAASLLLPFESEALEADFCLFSKYLGVKSTELLEGAFLTTGEGEFLLGVFKLLYDWLLLGNANGSWDAGGDFNVGRFIVLTFLPWLVETELLFALHTVLTIRADAEGSLDKDGSSFFLVICCSYVWYIEFKSLYLAEPEGYVSATL